MAGNRTGNISPMNRIVRVMTIRSMPLDQDRSKVVAIMEKREIKGIKVRRFREGCPE
jgi:hypothetical protein